MVHSTTQLHVPTVVVTVISLHIAFIILQANLIITTLVSTSMILRISTGDDNRRTCLVIHLLTPHTTLRPVHLLLIPLVPIPLFNALSNLANHLSTRDTEIAPQDTTLPPIRTNPALNTKPEISLKRYMPISRQMSPIKIKFLSITQITSFLKNILATEIAITTLSLRIIHSLTVCRKCTTL